MSRSLAYRPEIDGLRTLAVAAVILFHLDHGWLKGGFLGVDIFFVISGFLITSILHTQIGQERFSFPDFWKRRIRRLYPALLVVTGVTLAAGALVLVRPDRGELPIQALASLFSFQNIYLWWTTDGYWATDSQDLFLLHTWSLSLEEQFYLFFSVTLFLIHRFAKKRETAILLLLLAASLGLCVYGTHASRSAAFYLLPMRLWELLLGGLLAIRQARGQTLAASRGAAWWQALGVGLIAASLFLIENDASFPGLRPLLPCLGTLLILSQGSAPGLVNRLLSLGPMVYLGKLSYSLYLWHWPVIVFLRSISLDFNPLLAVGLTLLLSVLTYHFVECPFRFRLQRPRLASAWLAGGVAVCALPILLFSSSPMLRNLGNINSPESFTRGRDFEAKKLIRKGRGGLTINDTGGHPDLCVIGSSHARVLCPPIADYAEKEHHSALILTTSGIGIAGPSGKNDPDGELLNQLRLKTLVKEKPKVVIVAGIWAWESEADNFAERLGRALKTISENSGQVIVMGEVPIIQLPERYKNSMRKYLVALTFTGGELNAEETRDVRDANRRVEAIVESLHAANVSFVDPYNLFVKPGGGVKLLEDGKFLYSDRHHLNDTGASLVFERLLAGRLRPLLAAPEARPLTEPGKATPARPAPRAPVSGSPESAGQSG